MQVIKDSLWASYDHFNMQVTTWIIYLAPVGVLFLVAGQVMDMDDPASTFYRLGWYFFTVLFGLAIHGGIVLPSIYSTTSNNEFNYV